MSKIPEWQKWDLKFVFAKYIYPRLVLYKEEVDKRNIQSIPNWVNDELKEFLNNDDDELFYKKWSEILDEMIFAFKSYIEVPLNVLPEELKEKQSRGLFLFYKYYSNLWD